MDDAYPARGYPGPPEEETALRAIPRLIRRRFVVFLVPLLLVPAAAVYFASQQPNKYQSEATLLFRDFGTAGSASASPEREAATNVAILQTGVLEARAKAKLGKSPSDPTTTKIAAEGDSNLISIKTTSHGPQRAADVANGVANEFVNFRRSAIQAEVVQRENVARAQIAAVKGTTLGAKAQRRSLTRKLNNLKLEEKTTVADVRQIDRAVPNPSPVSPRPLRAGVIGAFLGLLIGLALAVARERLDLRVREPRQFEDAFGRPIIGRIPDSSALSKSGLQSSLPPVEGQAFRDLRANLRHAVGDRDARAVVVTSAIPNEGKTTVAWNLAREAAGAGARVLLVEADLRKPGLSVKLGTEPGAGLSDYIQGLASLEEATRQLPIPSTTNGAGHARVIDIVFAGSPPRDATGLLESDRMAWFLDHAAMLYDLVVIDTPPLSVASDAVPLIGRVSGVIVVGRLETTTRVALNELSKQLTNLDAHVLGIVVNSSGVPRDTYRYYYRGVPA